ncbi:MAG: NAD-dependent epimerase/dehydratase family protein [Saprospiraceae bacterium]|nr:NAD-dependent epimerase/dehydratase family protein [Saprospiraceae bacterium]
MRYFLTGATGFVGGYLAKLLRKAGHEVVALVRNPSNAGDLAAIGCTLVQGDVSDKASMRAPMTGCDGVFHVAGWYKIGARRRYRAAGTLTNVDGTRNVLELMQELGIKKGVYTSTLAVNSNTNGVLVDENYHFEGKHLSHYDFTKAEAHKIAMDFIKKGLPLVVVMPGAIYGPGDTSSVRTTLIQYLKGKLPMIPRKTALSWAHVEDIAQAHYAAMTQGKIGEKYIIAGPTHTLVDAMGIAHRITGKRPPRAVNPGLLSFLSKFMTLFSWLPLPTDYMPENLRVLAGTTYIGDNAKAKAELGYEPRSLKDGMSTTLWHEMKLLGMVREGERVRE